MIRNTIIFLSLSLFFTINPLKGQEDEMPNGKLGEASRAMKARNFHEAAAIYRELLDQNPDDMTLKQFLCHALINEKEYTTADSMLWKMVEKDSNNSGNYWYLGLSCERQRQDSIAADYFKTYIRKTEKLNNMDVKAWLHVGSAYRRMMHDSGISEKQYNDLIYYYKKYLKLNPADPYIAELEAFLVSMESRKPEPGRRLVWDEKN